MKADMAGKVAINAIVLFGSTALGEFLDESDVDICFLSVDFDLNEPMIRRLEKIQPALEPFIGIDPVCLCPGEVKRMDHVLVLDILNDGVVLLDDGSFRSLREQFKNALEEGRIVPFEGGWQISPMVQK